MYGDTATKLVQAAKRTQTLTNLPPYSTDLVRQTLLEVRQLDAETQSILLPFQGSFDPSQDPATACALLVNHLSMRRNKRCLLAYHRIRMSRIEKDIWAGKDIGLETSGGNTGAGGSGAGMMEDTNNNNLSPEEEEYGRRYGELLAAYKGRWTDVDLTGNLDPPRELFIDVRVLKDAGEIQTEYGAINLSKNSQFYVRQADVERLISQGYLQKLG